MRRVQLEMEVGPEMLTEAATPTLRHLAPEQLKHLLIVFQDVSALFGASAGKTNLVEHVVHLKDE